MGFNSAFKGLMNLFVSTECRPENVADCSYITVSGMLGVMIAAGENSLTSLSVAP